MSWIQKLLGEMATVDLSKPAKGRKLNPKIHDVVGELPDDLKRLNRILDGRLERLDEIRAKIGDEEAVHETEKHDGKTCQAFFERLKPLMREAEDASRDAEAIKRIFFAEIREQFGDVISGKDILILEGDILAVQKEEPEESTLSSLLGGLGALFGGLFGGETRPSGTGIGIHIVEVRRGAPKSTPDTPTN